MIAWSAEAKSQTFARPRIHQRWNRRDNGRYKAQGPSILPWKFAVWLQHITLHQNLPGSKQSARIARGCDHTGRCLLFAGPARCIPLPLKIWRSKIWQQKLRKPRFRASTETTKLLNISNNVTCHNNSHLLSAQYVITWLWDSLDQYQVNPNTVALRQLQPNCFTKFLSGINIDGMSRTATSHASELLNAPLSIKVTIFPTLDLCQRKRWQIIGRWIHDGVWS